MNKQKIFAIANSQLAIGIWRWNKSGRLAIAIGLGLILLVGTISISVPVIAAGRTQKILSTPANVIWGELFKPDSKPIARVKSGDRVVMETISHEGILPDQGDTVRFFAQGGIPKNPKSTISRQQILSDQLQTKAKVKKTGPGPHVITGPVYIEGAVPGDVLEIKTLDINYRSPYGAISNRHGKGALPGEYPENNAPIYSKVIAIDARREVGIFQPANNLPPIEIPLKPFIGLMGVVPANPADAANSVPPGNYGGNLDIKLLGRGSSLYLPVQVPGALFYAGDPHCAQANGEVALTAIECSLTPTFEFVLHKDMKLATPMGETKDAWIAVGLDKDLDEAMKKSVREYLQIANEKYGMTKQDALMLGSAAIDFDVSQVVDIVKGIHGTIPKQLFPTK
ncbi:MAG: Formamidase [Chroococcidiopsis cubana SAG 39.79]|uniref:Formamidase n=1 Tax=Chroococcidiopsis cubana SAG 39.79 TaxID=388085 RepID=A0AB37UF64_9CYAN|nr:MULTISPECIES: acetamidase/formamidase family protein [Chroococcidiopsis]MDZ4875116.1 Formamidase [Chroococcidiopsis cubana SAG 39.79]PSB61300.1 acetamidase [Chroococcidiopsis cubana CCALA 043]RUT09393.1 formamidase [Chroococcidiopsis cubana SAG 39.79]URD52294.1 acetamidase/formamidase family protein [Chroococcidiopsis sp. CCNUC1]